MVNDLCIKLFLISTKHSLPIEREDILSLCNAIDVLDAMEGTSAMFEMYSIEYTDEYMAEFVENIQKQLPK